MREEFLRLRGELSTLVPTVSMEADSTSAVEQEMVFYCEIKDLEMLKSQAKFCIDQEQWEVRSPTGKGRFRVRSERFNDGDGVCTEYECTVKSKSPTGGELETNQPVDELFFNAVKHIATNGMIKTRYMLPVFEEDQSTWKHGDTATYVWEFDVFEGTEWCKVDLELPTTGDRVRMGVESFLSRLVSLPFVGKVIRDAGDDAATVRKLYEDHFLIKHEAEAKAEGAT